MTSPTTPSQFTDITDSLESLDAELAELFNRKANMTKPVFQALTSRVGSIRDKIINFLLPLAVQCQDATSNAAAAPPASYSSIVKGNAPANSIEKHRPQPRATSSIIVRQKDDSAVSAARIEGKVSEFLSSNRSNATIIRSVPTKTGDVVVKFRAEDDVHAIAFNLRTELGMQASSRSLLKPKLTVSHIPAHVDVQHNLRQQILESNSWLKASLDRGGELDVLFTYKPRDFHSAVLKVSADIRKAILDNDKMLVIGNRACPAQDRLHVNRCSNCSGYGHKSAACKATAPSCGFCGDNHLTKDCPHKQDCSKHNCVNCLNDSSIADTNHRANDKNCSQLQREIQKLIRLTDYGDLPPTI